MIEVRITRLTPSDKTYARYGWEVDRFAKSCIQEVGLPNFHPYFKPGDAARGFLAFMRMVGAPTHGIYDGHNGKATLYSGTLFIRDVGETWCHTAFDISLHRFKDLEQFPIHKFIGPDGEIKVEE